jgi:diguanylate cyclase (GGDEF)-like protein
VRAIRQYLGGLHLRVQIGLLTGLLSVALVVLVSAGAAVIGQAEARRDAAGRMTQLATEMAHRLDSSLAERYREIGTLAQMGPLQGVWTGDPAVLRGVLEQLQQNFPYYAWIGFAPPDGIVRAATGGLLEGKSVAQRDWFRLGQHGPAVVDVHDAALLGKLLGPDESGEPPRFVDIAFPVVDVKGAKIGVLAAHLDTAWVASVRTNFLALLEATRPDDAPDIDIRVLSADGHVIVGPMTGEAGRAGGRDAGRDVESAAALDEPDVQQVQRRGVGLRTVHDGHRDYLEGLAVARGERGFPGFGWIVAARERTSRAYASVRYVIVTIVTIGAAVAVFGITLSYFLGVRIARPMRQLCDDAERLGRSVNGATLERAGGCLEVSQLSHSLRSLVRRLGMAERQLVDAVEKANMTSAHVARQIELLRRLADTDPMTGLLNRRGFLEAVQRGLSVSPGIDAMPDVLIPGFMIPGVLIIDIDYFKRVNDRYGHSVGDGVIQVVAKVIQSIVRRNDLAARFGGEEFVVMMPDATEDALLGLAERIRSAVHQRRIVDGVALEVSVSIGAAIETADDADVQDTIDRADRALYQAKESGRNCVRISNGSHPLTMLAA